MSVRPHHRVFFTTNGDQGPWACYYCECPVIRAELRVHHLDENHDNDVASNLVAIHHGCHTTLHKLGKRRDWSPSIAQREAVANAGRNRVWTTEMREKVGAAHRGKPGHSQSDEAKKKIGIGARATRLAERRQCPYCPLVSNAGAVARHIKAKHQEVSA